MVGEGSIQSGESPKEENMAGVAGIFFSTRVFGDDDVAKILAHVKETAARRVLFVDTPPTAALCGAVSALLVLGIEVVLRDHHDVAEVKTPRDAEIRAAADGLRAILGANAVISNRTAHPGCASLVGLGEFAREGDLVIADADRDGTLAAMKAVGVTYDGHDRDAAILDGAWSEITPENGVSEWGMTLFRGFMALPPFNLQRPQELEGARDAFFGDFVRAVQGDGASRQALEARIEVYEAAVQAARRVLGTASEVLPGVWQVDARSEPRYDPATLTGELERVHVDVLSEGMRYLIEGLPADLRAVLEVEEYSVML